MKPPDRKCGIIQIKNRVKPVLKFSKLRKYSIFEKTNP
jgi:hypothetical protein